MSNKEKIVAEVPESGMSATKIAKAIGLHKAKQIMSDLEELVADGFLAKDEDGRYTLYKKIVQVVKTRTESKTKVIRGKKIKKSLDVKDVSELKGYTVTDILYKGEQMKKITTPTGKRLRMSVDDRLLVINDNPKYVRN
jgi:hypothetical protein